MGDLCMCGDYTDNIPECDTCRLTHRLDVEREAAVGEWERIRKEIIRLENNCINDSEDKHSQIHGCRQLCDCVDCCMVSAYMSVRHLILGDDVKNTGNASK